MLSPNNLKLQCWQKLCKNYIESAYSQVKDELVC